MNEAVRYFVKTAKCPKKVLRSRVRLKFLLIGDLPSIYRGKLDSDVKWWLHKGWIRELSKEEYDAMIAKEPGSRGVLAAHARKKKKKEKETEKKPKKKKVKKDE